MTPKRRYTGGRREVDEMFPIREFEKRFREILTELDGVAAPADGESAEALEELNAELEDALLLLSEADPDGEDGPEELRGDIEELDALCGDYGRLAKRVPAVAEPADRLQRLVRMAAENLK